ncbi:hypothetical protein V1478_000184 [Vespula squamosa]|uniref:Uncharacterized protein n=1 Tax=Vespula squamosa TaxID=30214 RepID=A0ABD2C8Q1_VESSQ
MGFKKKNSKRCRSQWYIKKSDSLKAVENQISRGYDVSDTRDVAKELSIDHETVVNHSKKDGCKKRASVCGVRD